MAIVLTILGFIFLIISMRVKFLNRLCTLLFNITRLVLLIILINNPAKLYTEEIDMSIILLIIAGVTTFLTLYGLGSTAFDDTREEDAMNVKVGKGYGGSITFSCSNKICYLEAIHDHFDIEYD